MLVSNPRRAGSLALSRRRLVMLARTLACLPLALVAAAALAAPAHAFQVGIQDDGAFVTAPAPERAAALDRARAIGATYLRINFVWAGFRNDGFAPYDAAINQARRAGMTIHLTVTGNPIFTDGGRGYINYRRPSPRRYGRWIGAVARHFRGRVKYYSVWNEPNLSEYLWPQVERGRAVGHIIYRNLFRAAYRAVHRADPAAKVLIGEAAPSGHPVRFVERAAGRGLVADGWAHHPYQFVHVAPGRPQSRYSGGISNVGKMKATLRRLARQRRLRTPAGRPLPIYFTEFGYPRPGAYYGFFSEARRTSYALQAFRLAKRSGVRVLVWYQLYMHPGGTRPRQWDTGLVGRDGRESSLYRRLVANRRSLAGF